MTILTIKTDNKAHAKKLAGFLKTIGYVKEVRIGESEDALAEEDWILPGRRATEDEIDELLNDMDKDGDTGYTTEQMLAQLDEWKKKSA